MLTLAMISWQEMMIPLLILLLLFGGSKLPALARAAGSSISQFKRGLKEDPDLLDPPAGGDPPAGDAAAAQPAHQQADPVEQTKAT